MTNPKITILLITVFSLVMHSCASFTKNKFRKEIENLNLSTINKLNGNYAFNPIRRYYSYGKESLNDRTPDSLTHNNAYDFLANENKSNKKKNEYQVCLHLESIKRLRIRLLENSKIIKDTVLTGAYKKGMFYLNNKYLDCHGVPFILGGCSNNKRRVGLTKKGNLLINEAVSNEGALLLIIGSGHRYNLTYEYERK